MHHGLILVCPDCGAEMTIKAVNSEHVVPHFAHKRSEETRPCSYGSGESQEHMAAKLAIAKHISDFGFYDGATIQVERKFVIPDGHKPTRRADVVAILPTGDIHVHEAQLSPMSIETLRERTSDYKQVCTEVVWWLGGDARLFANELEADILGIAGKIKRQENASILLTEIDVESALAKKGKDISGYFSGLYYKALANNYHAPGIYPRLIKLMRDAKDDRQ